MHRHSVMLKFNQAADFAWAYITVINNGYASFVQSHPNLAENLSSLRNSLLETVANWRGDDELYKAAQ